MPFASISSGDGAHSARSLSGTRLSLTACITSSCNASAAFGKMPGGGGGGGDHHARLASASVEKREPERSIGQRTLAARRGEAASFSAGVAVLPFVGVPPWPRLRSRT